MFAADLMLSMAEFPEGRMVIAILQDITERKSAEERQAALLKQLQESLLEIKALRGLLPICSHCKRIRDDHGFWQQVEVYIRDHSNAEFSHGICPRCIAEFYPGFLPAGRIPAEGEGLDPLTGP